MTNTHTPSVSQAKIPGSPTHGENVVDRILDGGSIWAKLWYWGGIDKSTELHVDTWGTSVKSVREWIDSETGSKSVTVQFTTHSGDGTLLDLTIWGMTRLELVKALLD